MALETILQAYHDNADYEEMAEVAKAKAFVTACRRLLTTLPAESGTRESNVRIDTKLVAEQLKAATDWVAANDAGGTSGRPVVIHGALRRFRD